MQTPVPLDTETLQNCIDYQIYFLNQNMFWNYNSIFIILITTLWLLFVCCSVTKSCLTFWDPMNCNILGFPFLHCLWNYVKFMSIKLVRLSNHLIICLPLLLSLSIFPRIRVFSNKSVLHITWPQYWSFIFSISPSNEYSGLISYLIDCLWFPCCPKDPQQSSLAPQLRSISFSVLSLLYHPTLMSIHDYWKNHSFDYTDLCWKSYAFAF